MRRRERKHGEWETPENWTWDHVVIEVLMDIREHLQAIRHRLDCPNFIGIPATLKAIHRKIPTRKVKPK